MTKERKEKLKNILLGISSEDEKKEFSILEVAELNGRFEELSKSLYILTESSSKEIRAMGVEMAETVKRIKFEISKMTESMTGTYKEASKELLKSLGDLREAFSTSYAKDFSKNAAPVYKDMINAISAVEKSVKDKPVPHWNWPQYAGVSVRNKNFANINPAISPFGIADYDDIVLSYAGSNLTGVNYFLNGQKVAVLVLTYDGSNNLIEAKRIS